MNLHQVYDSREVTICTICFTSHWRFILYLLVTRKRIISLNSDNKLIVVMVKCGVLFEVRTGYLNII
jgi:hypothetical protein